MTMQKCEICNKPYKQLPVKVNIKEDLTAESFNPELRELPERQKPDCDCKERLHGFAEIRNNLEIKTNT